MNVTAIVGNLCADPNVRTTQNGRKNAAVRVAVKRPYSSGATDFFTVVAWGNDAEYLEKYARKGGKIAAHGIMQCREYTTRDGEKRSVWELSAEHVELIRTTQAAPAADEYEEVDDGELPF